jgi:hypothetical protein
MVPEWHDSWESRYVTVVREGGHRRFFERLLQAVEPTSLVIVSPWITSLLGEIPLSSIVDFIDRNRISTVTIMRHPGKEPMNSEAAMLMRQSENVIIYYNNELHAKIYVCRCSPCGFALLGSANLSGNATRAHEVGLMVEGKGPGEDIVKELEVLGRYDIPGRSGTFKDPQSKGLYPLM